MKNTKQITEEILQLPFSEFTKKICEEKFIPSVYGNALGYKLTNDLKEFKLIPASYDRGDGHIAKEFFFEIKTSIIKHVDRRTHRIGHIRFYQPYDFFILFFVDIPNNYKTKLFLIKKEHLENHQGINFSSMNGTKFTNESNKKVDKSTNIKKDDVDWLFSKYNQLNGTTYNDLLYYLQNITQKIEKTHN